MANTDILAKHCLQFFIKAFCPEKSESQMRRKIVKMSEGHRRHSIGKLFAWFYVDNCFFNFAAKISAIHKLFFTW